MQPQVASVRIARGSDEMLILGTDGAAEGLGCKDSSPESGMLRSPEQFL